MAKVIGTTDKLKDYPSNGICEADGCNAEAMIKITLKVGPNHRIQLFLCRTCKPKFCSRGDDSAEVEMQ
ncbi:MAG: hypothetical protein WBX01_09135 [Nitrososphaeraceae archaeon]